MRRRLDVSDHSKIYKELLKGMWLAMLEPPWRSDWLWWLPGWTWTLAGLLLGAFISPALVQHWGLANTRYQDALDIGIAVLTGMLVQLVGLFVLFMSMTLLATVATRSRPRLFPRASWKAWSESSVLKSWMVFLELMVSYLLPIAGVGYGVYRYLSWVGSGQRSVTVAFVGGLLIKTFLIPFLKGLVTGALFRWFMGWLRGGKAKSA